MQMSLTDKIKGLGHYARNAAKAITKPINTAIALVAISSALSFNEVQAQINTDGETVYGTGFFVTQNIADGENVGNVSLYLRPETMAMVTPNIIYEFTTSSGGAVPYSLPVYIDTTTTSVTNITKDKTIVLPNFGSELNAYFEKTEKGTIEMYSINGQLVKKQDFNTDHEYLQFDDLATGLYVYSIRTESGVLRSGKFLKQNVPPKGPSARPNIESSNFKNTQSTHTATYWAKWEHPDFYTDSTLITLEEGENNPIFLYMTSNIPPPIDNQDLEGYVWKLENTSLPLANAQVRATVVSTNVDYNATSDANGHFVINGLPLGEEIIFDVGGVAGRYSFAGTNYTTPSSISNPADSVNSNFSAVLPLKLSSSSANHIRDQTSNGTHQDTIWFYLGNTLTTNEKNTMRNWFTNLQSDEGDVYIFAESFTQLNNIGINIEYGTYNTNTTEDAINSPLGQTLYPIMFANTTMGTNTGYDSFVHEIKRALGFDEVAWVGVNSVMETPVQEYTQEDKDIAQFVERPYWNAVYQENKTWIDLNKIVEDMPGSKSLQSSKTSNSFNEDLEFNYQTK